MRLHRYDATGAGVQIPSKQTNKKKAPSAASSTRPRCGAMLAEPDESVTSSTSKLHP